MKKLFISCPMKGRKIEDIDKSMEKMHTLAEIYVGEKLEVIPSFIEDDPPTTAEGAVWMLGESIKKLSEADYMVCLRHLPDTLWRGCDIERDVACRYGIPIIYLDNTDFVAPDLNEIVREYWNDLAVTVAR